MVLSVYEAPCFNIVFYASVATFFVGCSAHRLPDNSFREVTIASLSSRSDFPPFNHRVDTSSIDVFPAGGNGVAVRISDRRGN